MADPIKIESNTIQNRDFAVTERDLKELDSLGKRFKVIHESNATIEDLFEILCRFQAIYCKITKRNAESFRIALMDMYHAENKKQCNTYAKTEPSLWKYAGAVLQIGGGAAGLGGVASPFAHSKEISDGLSGAGQGFGALGTVREEGNVGARTSHQHHYSNLRTFLDKNDRSTSNAYSLVDSLTRMFSEFVSRAHQNKMEMTRGA